MKDVEEFVYLDSVVTNDGRCTTEIKVRVAMENVALHK